MIPMIHLECSVLTFSGANCINGFISLKYSEMLSSFSIMWDNLLLVTASEKVHASKHNTRS